MLVCQDCHNKRQNRKAIDCQPLQFTGYETANTRLHCPDCGGKRNSRYFEYLTASELVGELTELKERVAGLSHLPAFPLSFYADADDMLQHRENTGQSVTADEAKEILWYAAELEAHIACK